VKEKEPFLGCAIPEVRHFDFVSGTVSVCWVSPTLERGVIAILEQFALRTVDDTRVNLHRQMEAISVEVNSLCTTLNVDESDCSEIIVRLKERELFLQAVLEQDPPGA